MTKEPFRPRIIIDSREFNGGIPKILDLRNDCDLEFKILNVGDYVVSDRCGIERKNIDDLFGTLFNRKELFTQLYDLRNAYQRPILIIEGGSPVFSNRNVNMVSMQGLLNTIALMGIPTLYSLDKAGTATILYLLAVKEQKEKRGYFSEHGSRSKKSPDEQLRYTVGSLPDMGIITAVRLLEKFGSIQGIANAEVSDIQEIPGIDKTAGNIHEFFRRIYKCQKQ